jgi:hypothetical protein
VQLVAGLKVGIWRTTFTKGPGDDWQATGPVLGINAGAYHRAGRVLLGVLAAFEVARMSDLCSQYSGSPDDCQYYIWDRTSDKVASLVGSVLF